MRSTIKINNNFFFYLFISMVWCQTILAAYADEVLSKFPFIGDYSRIMIMAVYALVLLLVMLFEPYNIVFSMKELVVFSLLLFVYFLSPILHSEYSEYWKKGIGVMLFSGIPSFLLGVCIVRKGEMKQIMHLLYKLSMVTIAVQLLYFFTRSMSGAMVRSGDMYAAYALLPHLCLVFYYVLSAPSFFNVVFFTVGTVLLSLLGSRGPVLLMMICVAIQIMLFVKWKHKTLIITLALLVLAGFVLSPLFELTVRAMANLAEQMGLSARIFEKLIDNDILNDSNRLSMYKTINDAIKQRPLTGYGIYADRGIIKEYTHNLPLELWVNFGYFIGSVVLVCILGIPWLAIWKTKDSQIKNFIVILFCVSVLKLFLSGSYLEEPNMYLMLGISIPCLEAGKTGGIHSARRSY